MKIELRPSDLYIKDWNDREVVNLRNTLAFDPDFIEEMKKAGVRKFVEQEEETIDTEHGESEA